MMHKHSRYCSIYGLELSTIRVILSDIRGLARWWPMSKGRPMDLTVDRRQLIQAGAALAGTTGMAGSAAAQAPAPAKLSTHALDMHSGKQAAGMRIAFSKLNGERWELIKTVTADEDGRVKDQ